MSSASSNPFEEILQKIASSDRTGFDLRLEAMELLSQLPGYNWSGIYRLEGDSLILDAYVGAHTDHTVIPIGRGVCGTAVAEEKNQIIEDVHLLDNYLACSLTTQSEIVVLIRSEGQIIGQIDIDGHTKGQFGAEDEAFLDQLGSLLAARWG